MDAKKAKPAGGRASAEQLRVAQESANPTSADEPTQPPSYLDTLAAIGARLRRFGERSGRRDFIEVANQHDAALAGVHGLIDELEDALAAAEAEVVDSLDEARQIAKLPEFLEDSDPESFHQDRADDLHGWRS